MRIKYSKITGLADTDGMIPVSQTEAQVMKEQESNYR
jgi:hypothetical protein